jgi:hypothetical protein
LRTLSFRRLIDLVSAARQEGGFALPTVLLGLVAVFGIGAAMVSSSLNSSSGVTRDTNTKSAFGVSEAGVAQALLRYNRFDTSGPLPCLNEGAGGQVILAAPQANGWCLPVTANTSGGSFSYSVKPTAQELAIVSTGYFDGLSRRVKVQADYESAPGSGGVKPFEEMQVFGKDSITISNGGRVTADVGTQGALNVTNGGKLVCDDAQAGSYSFQGGQASSCTPTPPNFTLPPVDSSVAKVTNHNTLLAAAGCHSWSATTKLLSIPDSCTLTLGVSGVTNDFYICKLSLTHSAQLYITPGAVVNVWFAPPNECAGNTVPYEGASGSKIRTSGGIPASSLAFLVSDSTTTTSMNLTAGGTGNWPSCDDNFVIYAPTTAVTAETGAHVCGGVAAKTISVSTGSSITKSSGAGVWELPGSTGGPVPHYVSSDFLECEPTNTSSTPDAGC